MALEKEDIERLKEIFVTQQECDRTINEINGKLSSAEVRTAVIETKLGQILWLCGAIGGGVITMLVKMFFGG